MTNILTDQDKIYDLIAVEDDYFPDHEKEQADFYQALKTVSEGIAGIILDEETPKILKNICQSAGLNLEQSAALSRLTRKILMAEIYLGEIVETLKENLSVEDQQARDLAQALIEQLFSPVLKELKDWHLQKFGKIKGEPTIIVPPASAPAPLSEVLPPHVPQKKEGEKPAAATARTAAFSSALDNPHNVLDLRKNRET